MIKNIVFDMGEVLIHFNIKELIPVKGMAELVKRLCDAGYDLYLLSNVAKRQPEFWQRVPGSSCFKGTVISGKEKMVKPQLKIYKLLLKRFKLKAKECIFIDDIPKNIAAGMICGIEGIVFKDAEDLENKLKEKGLEF